MTTEEKALAYDKAIEYAKYLLGNCPSDSEENKLKRMFPELAESEDEKIRKDILTYLLQSANSATLKVNAQKFNKWIAWLEKQGEKKAVLDELEMTLSVSEDAYLRENIEKLIKEFKKEQQ